MPRPGFKSVPADERIERFYQRMAAHMKRECDRDKSLRNIEVNATLGRLCGYCIALCYPQERDLVRALAIENIDKGTKSLTEQMRP